MKHGTTVLRKTYLRAARARVALASIVALALFAGACKSNQLDDGDVARAGTGAVTVTVAGSEGSRLVMPTAPSVSTIARYDLTCSREGYDSKVAAGLTDASALTVNELAEGTWVLTVDAFDASGKKVATGLANVTIVAGKTAAASVTLSPLYPRTEGGTGTVSLVFACSGFQANSNNWIIQLTPAAGGTMKLYHYESMQIDFDSVANTITLSAMLGSGDWDLSFIIKADSGDTFVSVSDVVKVYDGMNSVSSTGGPIPVSAAAFYKADRVLYVSNTAELGRSGKTRAQACNLNEAIVSFNDRADLTESDPGVIILTENVTYSPAEAYDSLSITRPIKIVPISPAPSSLSLIINEHMTNNFFVVLNGDGRFGSLTLDRVAVKPANSSCGATMGLISLSGTTGNNAKLTLNSGASITGNTRGYDAGGVRLSCGTLIMNAGSEISGNKAAYGGGVCSTSEYDDIRLNGGFIRANQATIAAGGVSLTHGALLSASTGSWKDTVRDNQADVALPDLARGYTGVSDYTTLSSALSGDEPAYIALAAGTSIPSLPPLVINKPVAIIGDSGSTLIRDDKDNPLLTITGNGILTLSGSLVIDGQDNDGSQSLISVEQYGTFIMAGSNVSLQRATLWGANGSAVSVAGTFWLKDGRIINNTTNQDGSVYVASTGVMRMDSGVIRDGKAVNGAGVCVGSGGKCYLYGGLISQNQATGTNAAGGVYVDAGGELYLRNYNGFLNGTIGLNAPAMQYGGLAVASAGKVYFTDVETPSSVSWISINGVNAIDYPGFINSIYDGRYQFF